MRESGKNEGGRIRESKKARAGRGKVERLRDEAANRKRSEKLIRESERKLKSYIDSIAMGISIISPEMEILDMNEISKEWFPKIDLKKKPKCYKSFYHPPRKEICSYCPTIKTFKDGKIHSCETDLNADGNYYLVSAAPLKDKTGRVTTVIETVQNITERRQTEQELHKNQRMLIRAQNVARMGFLTWNMITNEMRWSDEIFNIYGIDQQKVKPTLGLTMQLVHPDDLEFVQKNLDMAIQGVTEYDIDHRILRPDGKIVWVHAQAELTKKTDGISFLFGTVVDITKRKKTEDLVVSTKARLEYLLSSSLAVIYSSETSGNYAATFISKNIEEIMGYEPEEFIKDANFWFDRIHPEDKPRISTEVPVVFNKGHHVYEYRFKHRDGTYRWMRDEMKLVYDSAGNPMEIVGCWIDITERKNVEEEILIQRNKLQAMLGAIDCGITIQDLDYSIIYQNDYIKNVFGDRLGEKCYRVYEGLDKVCGGCPVELAYKDGKSHISVRKVELPSGEIAFFENIANPIRDADGKIISCLEIARDITKRKEVDKKLMTYQNNLRSLASKLVSTEEHHRQQIAANLHNNISQTLALSVNQLRRLRESVASAEAETLDEICRTIEETGQNVRNLTFDLASPLLYKLGLKAAISEMLDEQLRNRHGIACKFSDDKKDKPLDDNIRVLLFQAVRELLINVVKHAKASKVEIAIQRENDNIQIIISDDGVGFDTQKAETTIQRSGGFGLFNIRERLDYSGGSFEMYSQPGSGSRFVLTAPIKTKTD